MKLNFVYLVLDGTNYPIDAYETMTDASERAKTHNREIVGDMQQPLWRVIRLKVHNDKHPDD